MYVKILFVSHSPNLYGAETALWEEIKAFLSHDHDCVLLVPDKGRLLTKFNGEIPIYVTKYYNDLYLSSKPKTIVKQFINFIKFFYLMYICFKERPDFIYVNSRVIFTPVFLALVFKIKVIIRCHEDLENHFGIRLVYPETLIKKIYSNSNVLLLPVSNYLGSILKKKYGCRSVVVYQPVTCEYIETLRPFDGAHIKFVYVGSITREKNVDTLIQFFKSIRLDEDCKISFDLYGEGDKDYIDYLNQISGSDVTIYNKYSEHVDEIFFKYDIFISASTNEAFGRVFVEALASGLEVIVPYSGGATEITGIKFYSFVIGSDALNRCVNSAIDNRKMIKFREPSKRFTREKFYASLQSGFKKIDVDI